MIKPWYDLVSALPKQLGKTLIHWSKNMHSHPGYMTADEWQALLYMHGCTLYRYGKGRYGKEDYATNYRSLNDDERADYIRETGHFDATLVLTAPDGFFLDESDVAQVEAKHSLQWVADNFHTLWD